MPDPSEGARAGLLPCPFCGSAPFVEERRLHGQPCWVVMCRNNDCGIEVYGDHFASESDLLAAWNTRPTAPGDGLAGGTRSLLVYALAFVRDPDLRALTRGECGRMTRQELADAITANLLSLPEPKEPTT
jgi:hypothetical protein